MVIVDRLLEPLKYKKAIKEKGTMHGILQCAKNESGVVVNGVVGSLIYDLTFEKGEGLSFASSDMGTQTDFGPFTKSQYSRESSAGPVTSRHGSYTYRCNHKHITGHRDHQLGYPLTMMISILHHIWLAYGEQTRYPWSLLERKLIRIGDFKLYFFYAHPRWKVRTGPCGEY